MARFRIRTFIYKAQVKKRLKIIELSNSIFKKTTFIFVRL